MDIRRVNGKAYVTEERLNQFGRELQDGLVEKLQKQMGQGTRSRSRISNPEWKKTAECFYCHEVGHILKECPQRKKAAPPATGGDTVEKPLNG